MLWMLLFAANAVIGLMEPTGSGIGGDLMAIVWEPQNKTLHGLNAGGRSSHNVTYDQMMKNLNGSQFLPPYGPYPVNVPGCVDGWFQLYNRFGSKNLTMSQLLSYAIEYATNGFPLTQIIAATWSSNVVELNRSRAAVPLFQNFLKTYTINGSLVREGLIFKNPDLAKTLQTIANGGRDAFYNGTLTDTMAEFFKEVGCCLTRQDFETHYSTWETPINTTYRNYTVFELQPNTQGLATLQMLNILENFNLSSYRHNSAEFIHVSVEAKKLAWADRAKYYADPLFFPDASILKWLLDKDYAKNRSKLINMGESMQTVQAGINTHNLEKGDTIYMTTADSSGMMVSFIQSNYQGLGSGLVPTGLGFCFQDRGQLFSMFPNTSNVYAPGKRPFHTIIPAFVTKGGIPYMSFGVMGGAMQPQGQVQILLNMIDYKMDVQAAGDSARWYHFNDNEPTGEVMENGGTLGVESGITLEVQNELKALGHKISPARGEYGGYQAIMWDDENKAYHGASEMRKDGQAAGW